MEPPGALDAVTGLLLPGGAAGWDRMTLLRSATGRGTDARRHDPQRLREAGITRLALG